MSSDRFNEIDWEATWNPLYGSPIEIPPYTILWRGYDTAYPSISDHPSYYSSEPVARGYAVLSGRTLGAFYSLRPLRVLDVRHMKQILSSMMQANKGTAFANDWFFPTLSFGLCSLRHQINLYKHMYAERIDQKDKQTILSVNAMIKLLDPTSIVEPAGIRIGETTLDGQTMRILKEIFQYEFDGFIAPRTPSVFHMEKNGTLSPELILFSPKNCQLYHVNDKDAFSPDHNKITILSLLKDRHEVRLTLTRGQERATEIFYMKGGAPPMPLYPHPLDHYDMLRNQGKTKQMDRYAEKTGKRLRSINEINRNDRPSPTVSRDILDRVHIKLEPDLVHLPIPLD